MTNLPTKLHACNDELWVGVYKEGVFVYNLDLEQTKHIEHPQLRNVRGVVKTPEGVIVCDCDTGVHQLNHQGDYTNLICSSQFSDVCLTSQNKIYALECNPGEIHIFGRDKSSWSKETQFTLTEYSDGCYFDKLCTTSAHVYVSSFKTHWVLIYTLSGEFVYKTGGHGVEVGKLDHPILSDVDSGGKLLVCDWRNDRLQVFDTQTRVWSELSGLGRLKWPWCAAVGEKHIWVGFGSFHKLLKFAQ